MIKRQEIKHQDQDQDQHQDQHQALMLRLVLGLGSGQAGGVVSHQLVIVRAEGGVGVLERWPATARVADVATEEVAQLVPKLHTRAHNTWEMSEKNSRKYNRTEKNGRNPEARRRTARTQTDREKETEKQTERGHIR